MIYRLAYVSLSGDVAAAEDVTQNTFLRFLRYADWHAIENDAHLLAYLRQTARQLCWVQRREGHRMVPIHLTDIETNLAAEIDSNEEMDLLLLDIAQLSRGLSQEEQLLLRDLVNETPVQEIAERLNVTYGGAAVRKHRLRNKIRLSINKLHV